MKKILLQLLLTFGCCTLYGQPGTTITINDGNCFDSDVLTYNGSSGAPARNTYLGTANGGGGGSAPTRVIWENDRWEVQTDPGTGFETTHYNTTASAPKPPALSLGTWVNAMIGCGNLTTFSGDGTTTSLPVELTDFAATAAEKACLLTWQTASEHLNLGFHIERSADAKVFTDLGFVPGNGTTTERQTYAYSDVQPLPGLAYYRLQQVDADGRTAYSPLVSVRPTSAGEISVAPNPGRGQYTLNGLPTEADYTVRVRNTQGQVVVTCKTCTTLDLSSQPTGVYLLDVLSGANGQVLNTVRVVQY